MLNEFFVPIDGLYEYTKSETWEPFKPNMKSKLSNNGKKFNYKKAVKHLKKAASLMPLEFTIEVKVDTERRLSRR